MSQDELGQCWRSLAERMEVEVLDKYKVEDSKREAFKGRSAQLEWRRGAQKQERQNKKVERRLLGQNLRLVQRTQLAATARQAGGVGGRRGRDESAAVIMKDLTKKIRSKGRMDAESRWWVSELLAADCEKAWIHPGCEDTMQKVV